MTRLHEPQISKTRKIAGYTLSLLGSLILVYAGVLKVIGNEGMLDGLKAIPNWDEKWMFLGILELVVVAIYWIPKMSNIGFFLVASFGGGIIVAEVVAGEAFPFPGVMVCVLIYVGTMLRKPSLSGLGCSISSRR